MSFNHRRDILLQIATARRARPWTAVASSGFKVFLVVDFQGFNMVTQFFWGLHIGLDHIGQFIEECA